MFIRRPVCLAVGLVASLACRASSVSGQELVEQELPKATATLKGGIKSARSLRELRDGRVLVVDGIAQRLQLVDFASGKVEPRMKPGAEDDEARSFGPLMAYAGDSIASLDNGKARLMLFDPDGAFARTIAMGGRGPRLPVLRFLVGTESAIGMGFPPRPTSPPNPAVATLRVPYPVIRFSLRTQQYDTVVQLLPAQAPRAPLSPSTSNAGTFVVYIGTAPVQTVDVWAAYPDGTVAVVRAATYRIEWFAPDGSRTSSDPVPFTPIALTAGDRKRVMDEYKRTAAEALQANPMRTAILVVNYAEPASWPATHPPFRSDIAPLVDRRDRLWLATRCVKDEQALCYDVIDRRGVRVERFKLPPKTVIVGFGKDVVYTFVDQNDVLQRHALIGPS